MSDYLKNVGLTPAVHESEWRVRLSIEAELKSGAVMENAIFLKPSEAKDLSQRLFHLALEISEREGEPQGGETLDALRAELRREREKRMELVKAIAPKDKLEAAKRAVRRALASLEELPDTSHHEGAKPVEAAEYEAALAWLEGFKA